jgi:RNA polymerase sigma-70 factor (ECF subfamily)
MGAHPDDSETTPRDARSMGSNCASEELKARFEADAVPLLSRLLREALRLTGNRADAEELLQETSLRAYRGFAGFQPGTNLNAWLYRILRNTFIQGYRKKRREPTIVPEDWYRDANDARSNVAPSAESIVVHSIIDVDLQEALLSLPERYRRPVLLYDVDGFNYKEIAELLGIPRGTVMSRLHRGRKALKERILPLADEGRGAA